MEKRESGVAWLRPRIHLLWTAGVVGVLVGGFGVVSVTVLDGLHTASTQVFSVGALVFGFAVLGWSGSALVGRGIETIQRRLDTHTDWTERDSRRAMARLSGFGAGVMIGVVVVTTAMGAVGL